MALEDDLARALNKLTKWRTVFAGWQLGTRTKEDPEAAAVRDHRELTMLLRVETNALQGLLIKKGVFTQEEWAAQVLEDAQHMDRVFEVRFPGFQSTENGMAMSREAAETIKGWRP